MRFSAALSFVSNVPAAGLWRRKTTRIAALSVVVIGLHLTLRFGFELDPLAVQLPLLAALVFGGVPLVYRTASKAWRREARFRSAGGHLYRYLSAAWRISGRLDRGVDAGRRGGSRKTTRWQNALFRAGGAGQTRTFDRPSQTRSQILDVALRRIGVGDTLVVFPHDICLWTACHPKAGVMDESYLTASRFRSPRHPARR
jgi:hypothetical protein